MSTIVNSRLAASAGAVRWLSLALVTVLVSGCTMAKPVVSDKSTDSDFVITNGEMDYAIAVSVNVTNQGEAGTVLVTANLRSNEGDWERQEKISLDAGERRRIVFRFPEPTAAVDKASATVSAIAIPTF